MRAFKAIMQISMSAVTRSTIASAALLLIGGCSGESGLPTMHLDGATMGTTYSVTLVAPAPELSLQAVADQIEARLSDIENLASTYRPSSELSRLNAETSADWIPVSAELCSMLSDSQVVSRQTQGAFDITIGQLVNLWGFGAYDRENKLPDAAEIAAAMHSVGYRNLVLDCERPAVRKTHAELLIDLSGWAKGYAVDQLATVLDSERVENYLVEIGGELRAKGLNAARRPFLIGIEHPTNGGAHPSTAVRVSNKGMATSGDYRNYFEFNGERYSHTIDPSSGWPIGHNLASVTVVADSAAYADAMATALLVVGLDAGMAMANQFDIAAFFMSRNEAGFEYSPSKAFAPLIES